jgi:hypothetical protein
MQIGYTKPFKKAVATFCIVAVLFFIVFFGSFYLGRYGFSFTHGQDDLWPIIRHDAFLAMSPAIIAAFSVYGGRKKKDESKSNDAT